MNGKDNGKDKERRKDILVNLIAGAIIAALVFSLNMSRSYGFVRCLCDGFFVAGVMLLGIGGIKAIRNQGTFDVVGFGLKSTLETVIPALRKGEKEDMEDYRQRKAGERKSAVGMLIAGAVYLVLALIVLGIYHAVT